MDMRRAAPIVALVGATILAFMAVRGLADVALNIATSPAAPGGIESGAESEDVGWLEPGEVARLYAGPVPHTQDGQTLATTVVEADRLELPSRRIVAGDVFLGDGEPLELAFVPGIQPVRLLLVRFDEGGDVVAAVAIGAPGAAVRWVPAFGSVAGPDGTQDPLGFAVDSGTAGFASAETAERMASLEGTDRILERLQAGWADASLAWLAIEPGAAEGTASMIAVVSGYGDGVYPVWWGVDGQDRPAALLTDFGVLYPDR